MKRDVSPQSERESYSLPVDPDKDSRLIEVLKYRGTFDDETEFDAPTGKTYPQIVRAMSRMTGSLLVYAEGMLTYTEGKNGAKGDAHATIFMAVTMQPDRQKDEGPST